MTDDKRKVKSAFLWVFFGTAGQNILQFTALIVLARLLTPADFGLVSAAMIIIGLIAIFSELGVGPAIVQKLDLTKKDVSTGKVISASIGLIMGIAIYFTSGIFEAFMRIDGLAHVVQILAFILPLSGLAVIGQSLLQRNLEFKKYTLCIFFSYFISQLCVAIPMASFGYGYYSLVIATLMQNIILLLALGYLTKEYRDWGFSLSSARGLANYGFGQSLGRIANYFAGEADKFFIGRVLGVVSLGYYGRAHQLMMVPANLFGTVLDKVMFPMMSKIQNNASELVRYYVLSTSIIAIAVIPIIAFVYVFSLDIIVLLLGSKWVDAAPILKLLVTVLFFRTSYKVSDTLSKAKGAVYKRAWRQMVYGLSVALFSYLGSFFGLMGVVSGVILSVVLNYLIMLQLSHSLIEFSYKSIFYIIIKNFVLLVFLIICTNEVAKLMSEISVGIRLVIGAAATLSFYILLVMVFRNFYREELKLFFTMINARKIKLRI